MRFSWIVSSVIALSACSVFDSNLIQSDGGSVSRGDAFVPKDTGMDASADAGIDAEHDAMATDAGYDASLCEPPTRRCGEQCTAEQTIETCGPSCKRCEARNGTPICKEEQCDTVCADGLIRCAGGCCSPTSYTVTVAPGGKYTSVAFDSRGNIHVVHHDDSGDVPALMHSIFDGESWSTTVIDSENCPGVFSSLAIDDADRLHVAYRRNCVVQDLWYATKSESSDWAKEQIEDEGSRGVGRFVSLAIDQEGLPVVAYLRTSGTQLRYAVRVGSSWAIEDVNSVDGLNASLVISDSQEFIGISNRNAEPPDTEIVQKIAGGWSSTQVSPVLADGVAAVAHSSGPVVLFSNPEDGNLWESRHAEGWEPELVDDSGPNPDRFLDASVDGLGNIHVVYYDSINLDLKYAISDGDSWTWRTLVSSGSVGIYPSIDTDEFGNAYIAFRSNSSESLMFTFVPHLDRT